MLKLTPALLRRAAAFLRPQDLVRSAWVNRASDDDGEEFMCWALEAALEEGVKPPDNIWFERFYPRPKMEEYHEFVEELRRQGVSTIGGLEYRSDISAGSDPRGFDGRVEEKDTQAVRFMFLHLLAAAWSTLK